MHVYPVSTGSFSCVGQPFHYEPSSHEIFQLGMDGYRHHQACSMFTLSAHSIVSIVGPLNMVVSVVIQHMECQ